MYEADLKLTFSCSFSASVLTQAPNLRCWTHHGHIPPATGLSWDTGKTMQSTLSRVLHKLPSISASLQRFLLPSFVCQSPKILQGSSQRLLSPAPLYKNLPWTGHPPSKSIPLQALTWKRGILNQNWGMYSLWECNTRKQLCICGSEQAAGRNDGHTEV